MGSIGKAVITKRHIERFDITICFIANTVLLYKKYKFSRNGGTVYE
ncbi:hypothetical protein CUS_4546 [Ruminococcus albus 8]|uniref:Uncharacterized protein n=1 Tax=Ruminococcus albus 8 TaxID=246199 RepID=E9SCA6_RUMAL|nr:hypothetical protein CUS_4546 [Ruminococcus albus 8]